MINNAKRKLTENKLVRFFTATKRRKIIAVVIILIVAYFQINNARKPDWELEVIEVKRQTIEEIVSASGSVAADKYTELTFLAAENIKEIVATQSAYLKKGDVIAQLDTTSLYQSYLQAESNLRAAEAEVNRVYDTLQGKEKTETYADIDARTTAEVTRDNAYRSLVVARKNLNNATLRAPFDGIVNFNSGVSIGKYTSALTPTFTIIDPSTTYFLAEVNEVDIGKIRNGNQARVELDAFSNKIDSKVTSVGYINTTTSTGGTAYEVRLSLPQNSEGKYRVGMNGDVDFIISITERAVSVPQSALIEEGENTYVWVVNPKDKAQKISVETGTSSINDIEITEGLENGNKVIVRPPADIKEGDKIKSKDQ